MFDVARLRQIANLPMGVTTHADQVEAIAALPHLLDALAARDALIAEAWRVADGCNCQFYGPCGCGRQIEDLLEDAAKGRLDV